MKTTLDRPAWPALVCIIAMWVLPTALAAQTATTPTGPPTTIVVKPAPVCLGGIDAILDAADESGQTTFDAASAPKLGRLAPLRNRLNVSSAGHVGIGLQNAPDRLTVAGVIASLIGGFRFPDDSLQTTAQIQGPVGPDGPQGASGPPGPQGEPGFASINGLTASNVSLAGGGAATVSTAAGTLTVDTAVGLCLYGGKSYSTGARCYLEGNTLPCPIGEGFVGSFMTCQSDGSWAQGFQVTCQEPWPNPFCGE